MWDACGHLKPLNFWSFFGNLVNVVKTEELMPMLVF